MKSLVVLSLSLCVLCGRSLEAQEPQKALQSTTESVFEVLARTAKRGSDELTLETDAQSLAHPMAMVQMRRLSASFGAPVKAMTCQGCVFVPEGARAATSRISSTSSRGTGLSR